MNGYPTFDFVYDPYAPEMLDDPWEAFKRLRDDAPVYYNPDRDLWVLSHYEDVKAAANDWRRFSSANGVTTLLHPVTGQITPSPMGPGDFLEMDPPLHDKLRAVVRGHFTPQAINALEPVIRGIANRLIDEFIETGHCDLATQFAKLLPATVITHMLGLPLDEVSQLSALWAHASDLPAAGQDPEEWSRTMIGAAEAMWSRFADAIEQRRTNPRADILSAVAHAVLDDQPLGEQAVGMCFLLYGAGEDTTVGLVTNTIRILGESAEQRKWLAEHPEGIPAAIEEILRYDGPFLHLTRTTTQEVTMHGITIPPEARVLLLWASANRDERQFESPDVLDFTRPRVAHLGFGHGLHHCLGSALAKVEGQVALELLINRLPDYQINGPLTPNNKPFVRGYRNIPATFTPGRRTRTPGRSLTR